VCVCVCVYSQNSFCRLVDKPGDVTLTWLLSVSLKFKSAHKYLSGPICFRGIIGRYICYASRDSVIHNIRHTYIANHTYYFNNLLFFIFLPGYPDWCNRSPRHTRHILGYVDSRAATLSIFTTDT